MTPITEPSNPTNIQTNTISNLNNETLITTPVAQVQEVSPEPATSATPVQEVTPVKTIAPTEATVTQVEPFASAPQPNTPKPLQENQNTVETTNVGAEPIEKVNSETQTSENIARTVTTDIFNSLPKNENK